MASSIFGGLLSLVGLGTKETPKADPVPATQEVADEEGKAKRARSALTQTAGGIMGEELAEGQVKRRDIIFGN